MRKLVQALAALALIPGTTVTLPSAAMAAPPTEIVCKDVIGPGPHPDDATRGECNSFFLTQGTAGFAAHLCDFLIETGQIEDVDFSDCVQAVRDGSV